MRVVDRSFAAEAALPVGVSFVHADIRDEEDVKKALLGGEVVFHLAGNCSATVSVREPRYDFESNALGAFNVIEASRCAGVRRLVYVSSASVYGLPARVPIAEDHPTKPFTPYGASKLAGESMALAMYHTCGLPVVVARPFCVYGAGENCHLALVEVARYLRWHLNGRPIEVVGNADRKTRDFVHVSDAVAALVLIADRGDAGDIYNIGSGEETSMRRLANVIGAVTGQAPSLIELPHVANDTYRLVADVSRLARLGYAPQTPLSAGVQSLVADLGPAPELPGSPTIFRQDQQAERVDEY